jgi:predicted esterase
MIRAIGRRLFLAGTTGVAGWAAAHAAAAAAADEQEGFTIDNLELDGSADLSRRAWVIAPKNVASQRPARWLVLWHGLGETPSERAGVGAWVERYGLLTACGRLARPPVKPTEKRGDLAEEHATEMTKSLEQRAFDQRFIFICPYTPNPWKKKTSPAKVLDRLAEWVASTLLPAIGAHVGVAGDATRMGIDGCSLGGLVSLEIFARRPDLFATCGGVQAAVSDSLVPGLAARIASAVRAGGVRRLHLETSRQDPFCAANLELSRELRRAGIAHDLSVLPGPHDQPWLREAGTLEMLLWHDRTLGQSPP